MDTQSSSNATYQVKGLNGQIELTPDTVTIHRRGLAGKGSGHPAIRLLIKDITAVNLKETGKTAGYIEFLTDGADGSKSTSEAAKSAAAVTFVSKQDQFHTLKSYIESDSPQREQQYNSLNLEKSIPAKEVTNPKLIATIVLLFLLPPIGVALMWVFKPWTQKARIIITAVAVFFTLVGIATDGGESLDQAATHKEDEKSIGVSHDSDSDDLSVARKMATINAGGYVKEDDITVKRFNYLLNEISRKTEYNKSQVANMTVYGWKTLEDEYGVSVGLLDFTEGANKALGENEMNVRYEELLSGMIYILKN